MNGKKLIVVDNDPDMRIAMETAVRLMTHSIAYEFYDTPKAALQAARADRDYRFVAAVLGVQFHEESMNGTELLRRMNALRGAKRHLPVLFVTGLSDSHNITKLFLAGMYLPKSDIRFVRHLADALDELVASVDHLLTSRRCPWVENLQCPHLPSGDS